MGIKFNKKAYCKCKKCKQVTEVAALAHLYDSLNDQIESARNEIKDFMQVGISSDISDEAKAKILLIYERIDNKARFETACTEMEKRFEKLINMRDIVEELLDKNLKAEVTVK